MEDLVKLFNSINRIVIKMPRPRKNAILRYPVGKPGVLTFPRREIEAEIPTIIKSGGIAYAGSEFEGRKVIILVLRE